MPVLLAFLCACSYGASDFGGGLATKRAAAVPVVFWSQLAGVLVLLAVVPFLPGSPRAADLGWGVAAGLAGALGMVCLYRGLAVGPMSLVSPLTAVCAAVVPVVGAVLIGERLPGVALVGVVLAVGAVVLLSSSPPNVPAVPTGPRRVAVTLGLTGGLGFGLFFLLLDRTSAGSGLWPLVASRGTSMATLAVAALVSRAGLRLERGVRPLTAWVGLGDMGANVAFLLATQRGSVAIVAVVASLYPAGTVLLASAVLRERVHRAQAVGLGFAAAAVVLIALA